MFPKQRSGAQCTYQEIAKQFQNCGLHYLHAFGSKNSRPLYVHLSGKIVFFFQIRQHVQKIVSIVLIIHFHICFVTKPVIQYRVSEQKKELVRFNQEESQEVCCKTGLILRLRVIIAGENVHWKLDPILKNAFYLMFSTKYPISNPWQ